MFWLSILAAASVTASEITAPGPSGSLSGTWFDAGSVAPTVLIIPGSGPTDRDGNNPLGVQAAPYRLLAEALAAKGVSTVRIDKRGMFKSKDAVADANDVTIADYARDIRQWVKAIRAKTGADCVWLLGHSEGGLVALESAQDGGGICGVILVAAPGRPMADILRQQLRANPANAPILEAADSAIATLEAGGSVDPSGLHPALQGLFAPAVQPFLRDMMRRDPARLAASLSVPLMIVHGSKDLQIDAADLEALSAAVPTARPVTVDAMNHVLKPVADDSRAANMATYQDPNLAVSGALIEAIVGFVQPRTAAE